MSDTTLTHGTLGDLFEDVADAIREKNPDAPAENTMIADTFPAEIRAIPSGSSNPRMEWELEKNSEVGTYFKKIHLYNVETIPTKMFNNLYSMSKAKNIESCMMLQDTEIIDETNSVQNIEAQAFISSILEHPDPHDDYNFLWYRWYKDSYIAPLKFIHNNPTIKTFKSAAFAWDNSIDMLKELTQYTYYVTTNGRLDLVLPPNLEANALAPSISASAVSTVYGELPFLETAGCIFANNPHIKSVTFPKQIKYIGFRCFDGCVLLEQCIFPSDSQLETILERALANTKLSSITLPSSLRIINTYAFQNCESLTEVRFLGTATDLSTTAFEDCPNLADIYVPWSDGEVTGAPWGATSATIHYNWTPTP